MIIDSERMTSELTSSLWPSEVESAKGPTDAQHRFACGARRVIQYARSPTSHTRGKCSDASQRSNTAATTNQMKGGKAFACGSALIL